MTTSESETITVTDVAQQLDWPEFFPDIVVDNLGDVDVWITLDGSPAVAGADGALVVQAGGFGLFSNRLPIPDIVGSSWPGRTSVGLVTESGWPRS